MVLWGHGPRCPRGLPRPCWPQQQQHPRWGLAGDGGRGGSHSTHGSRSLSREVVGKRRSRAIWARWRPHHAVARGSRRLRSSRGFLRRGGSGYRRGAAGHCPPGGHAEAPWGHFQVGPARSPLPSAPRSLCSGFMPLQRPPRTRGPKPCPAGCPGAPAPHAPRPAASPACTRCSPPRAPGGSCALRSPWFPHSALRSPLPAAHTRPLPPPGPHRYPPRGRTPWAATSPPPSTPSHFRQFIPLLLLAGPPSPLHPTLLCWVIPTGPPPHPRCTLGSLPAPPRTLTCRPVPSGTLWAPSYPPEFSPCPDSLPGDPGPSPSPPPRVSSLRAFHHGQGPSSPSKPHHKVQTNSPLTRWSGIPAGLGLKIFIIIKNPQRSLLSVSIARACYPGRLQPRGRCPTTPPAAPALLGATGPASGTGIPVCHRLEARGLPGPASRALPALVPPGHRGHPRQRREEKWRNEAGEGGRGGWGRGEEAAVGMLQRHRPAAGHRRQPALSHAATRTRSTPGARPELSALPQQGMETTSLVSPLPSSPAQGPRRAARRRHLRGAQSGSVSARAGRQTQGFPPPRRLLPKTHSSAGQAAPAPNRSQPAPGLTLREAAEVSSLQAVPVDQHRRLVLGRAAHGLLSPLPLFIIF